MEEVGWDGMAWDGTYLEVISNILISVDELLDRRDESDDELRKTKTKTKREK